MNTSINSDVAKFETLIDINALINSNYSDIDALLTKILESAMRLVNADASSLLLVNSSNNSLVFSIALGPKGSQIQNTELPIGKGIAGWVVEHNKSLIIDDTAKDPRFFSGVQTSTGYVTTSMIAAPLRVKGECVGVVEILNKGENRFFSKCDLEWIERLMDQASIAYQNAKRFQSVNYQVERLQDSLSSVKGYHTLIYKSPVIQEKIDIINRVASTNSSVLILGESGVGKELFAEQIHLRSNRNTGPFIRVNCAALPDNMLESELFGHIKGAFTDAVANRQGRFESADGGTIFLDEIGELPLNLQAKLLRVIQDKTFEKVGSSETIQVDVRIIAATNRDLEKQVDQGAFRSDLYYRLNVLPLYIPPLCQHQDDIPLLIDYFLKKFSWETKKAFVGLTAEAMDEIFSYSWPGNIRELENVIERSCVIGTPPYINSNDLLLKSSNIQKDCKIDINTNDFSDLKTAVNTFKRKYIKTVLDSCGGNQTEAAKILEIQRTYLSSLRKELEI